MKSKMHKVMYKEMLGHLIKKMRKGMVDKTMTDKAPKMNMSESDVMEEMDEEVSDSGDFASPEELQEYLKPKKKKTESAGIAIFAGLSKKSGGMKKGKY